MKTLAELRAMESDLVARAAAKLTDMNKEGIAADAVRALETEHDALLDQIEQVRAQIATAVEAERATASGDVLQAERARSAGIRKVARQLGLADELVDQHVERGTTLNSFRQIAIDAAAARQAEIAPHNPGAADPQHRTFAAPRGEKPKGTDAARAMIALAACRGSLRDASDYVSRHYGTDGQHLARALSTSVGSAGGFLVPPEMSSEVIELLRPASAVMALGPIMMPMASGNMSIPRVAGGASAGYVGENQPTQGSQQSFGMVQLSAKKLTSVVPMSNDMIRFPSAATDTIVRDDMVKSIAMRADLAFIRGQGTQFSPKGLKTFAAAASLNGANTIAATPQVGSAFATTQANAIIALMNVTYDLSRLELALENANITMTRPGWIMSPRSKTYLMNLRDGNGNLVFYAEMSTGKLRGKPYKITTQVPNNLAAVDQNGNATVDGSEVYLADFAEVIIGEAHGLELDVFPGGAYVDNSGNLVSGVSNDQTVMRAIIQHDMNMRQEAAAAVLTGVRWF